MPGPLAAAAITAAIPAVASLFGAKKGANATQDAANIQTDFAEKALEEQKRVYDLERADEERQRQARNAIFQQYGTDPGQVRGQLPNPYGMDDAQTAEFRRGTVAQSGGGGAMAPKSSSLMRIDPERSWKPHGGTATVTLQAPTGEIMEVDIDQAPGLIQKGAVMIPQQGRNAFGGPYGMV